MYMHLHILCFQCEILDIVSELRRQRQGMIQTRVCAFISEMRQQFLIDIDNVLLYTKYMYNIWDTM